MKLLLERDTFTNESTTGILYQEFDEGNGNFSYEQICYTLEDRCREEFGKPETFVKVYGETAIPYGKYKIVIDWSPKFKKDMPHILDVKGYEGVRLHVANTAVDVLGCVGLGCTRTENFIGDSRKAFAKFFDMLKRAIEHKEEVWIEISQAEEIEDSRTA